MSQTPDAKAYYGYLFEPNKQPTKVLDALLRGIASHIIDFLGRKEDKCLTPAKLASFYKAVGGNYDSLFVDVPYPSISWIYASIGCQHTLQPTENEFAPPSIPALTIKGFVRWQSIEILLGPEEHVPFIQNAVRNFPIRNPDTGDPFPLDLPTEAFPLKSDVEIEKWHNTCAERLRQKATPDEDEGPRPNLPPRPKVQAGFAHIRIPSSSSAHYRGGPKPPPPDYFFEPKSRAFPSKNNAHLRPIPYAHVPGKNGRPVRPGLSHSPSHRERQFLAPEAPESPRLARSRRRSVPENMNMNSSPVTSPNGVPSPLSSNSNTQSPSLHDHHPRRHSHPRQARRGSMSSDASSEAEEPGGGSTPRRNRSGPDIRFEYPSPGLQQRHRTAAGVDEDGKRRGYAVPIDRSGKLSEPFLLGKRDKERDRLSGSKGGRGNVTWKDLAPDMFRRGSRSSEEDREKLASGGRRVSRDEGVLGDRDSGSGGGGGGNGSGRSDGYKSRDRERERDRDRDRERERDREQPARSKFSRHSSHELDRDWERERERDREAGNVNTNGGRSFKERDRERRGLSPVKGVDGRYYPTVR